MKKEKFIVRTKSNRWQIAICKKHAGKKSHHYCGTYDTQKEAIAVRDLELEKLEDPTYFKSIFGVYAYSTIEQWKQDLRDGMDYMDIAKRDGVPIEAPRYYRDKIAKEERAKFTESYLGILLYNKWDKTLEARLK